MNSVNLLFPCCALSRFAFTWNKRKGYHCHQNWTNFAVIKAASQFLIGAKSLMCANCQSVRDAWSSHSDTAPIFQLSEVSDVPVWDWDPSLRLSLYLSPVSPLGPGSELGQAHPPLARSACVKLSSLSLLVNYDKVKHQEREHEMGRALTQIVRNFSL